MRQVVKLGKIKLENLEAVQGMQIIRTKSELDLFWAKLRQDYYARDRIKDVVTENETWLSLKRRGNIVFLAVHDEKDDFIKNDNWGEYRLYQCFVTIGPDGKIWVVKKDPQKFAH
jgi:hypothetical protein